MARQRNATKDELITTPEATCQRLMEQIKAKTEKAAPYIEEAIQFWNELKRTKTSSDVLKNPRLRQGLIATAGISTKTLKRLQARNLLKEEDIERSLTAILQGIPTDRAADFREEIFYRYLLTKGASFDGEMKNYTGAKAARELIASLLDTLQIRHDPSVWLKDVKGSVKLPEGKILAESHKVQKIAWNNRVLLFDKEPSIINKNVDIILLNAAPTSDHSELLRKHECYLACGELKGGIDPAGTGQRWPAAKSTFDAVLNAFASKPRKPALFFVGAAIDEAMVVEIRDCLRSGKLKRAANLTVPQQVADLISWLVAL